MPIFFQHDIDRDTKVGIWKIEEDEFFFLKKVIPQRNVSHPHKKLQHLAGRYLLKYLYPDFPIELIRIADTRKPFLEDEAYHFSISHCGQYAAAIVSKTNRVGVDAELTSEKIVRIRHKFVSKGEFGVWDREVPKAKEMFNVQFSMNSIQDGDYHLNGSQEWDMDQVGLTLIWSCKEAVFKWYGLGGVDFRDHIQVKRIIPIDGNRFECIIVFKKNEDLFLDLHSVFFDELCLSYVTT